MSADRSGRASAARIPEKSSSGTNRPHAASGSKPGCRGSTPAFEPGTRPMCPGDPLGNHRQRPIAVSLVFEPVLAHEDGMGVPAPLPHQGCAGLQRSAGVERTSAFLELSRQNLQAALQGGGPAAMGTLLQLIGEPPDDQIATEAQRRADVMQSPPPTPQLLCRQTGQPGDFAIKISQVPI